MLVGVMYPVLDYWIGLKSTNPSGRSGGVGGGSGVGGRSTKKVKREWSSVIRCCGGFMGVNYAASVICLFKIRILSFGFLIRHIKQTFFPPPQKLPWTSSIQVSLTLALLALGLWFLFDRTLHGFIISAVFASVGTWVVFILVSNGVYR